MSARSFSTDLAQLPETREALRIVVGWDSSNSNNTEAIEFAAWLGRSLPVKVQVMSATKSSWANSVSEKKHKKWLKRAREEFRDRVDDALDGVVPRSQRAKHVARLIEKTSSTEPLYDAAAAFNADMIVMGSRAKTSKKRFRPTSVAEELMHSSTLPLGLAPKHVKLSKKGITRVTYALIDSDEISGTGTRDRFPGLAYAASLASVIGVPLRIIAFSPDERSSEFSHELAAWNESTLGLLDRVRDQAFEVSDSLDVQTLLASGRGWKRAVDSVKWKKGDIMCLGSQPSGQLKRVFVGTREGEFIRFAPVPVVIYPRSDAEG